MLIKWFVLTASEWLFFIWSGNQWLRVSTFRNNWKESSFWVNHSLCSESSVRKRSTFICSFLKCYFNMLILLMHLFDSPINSENFNLIWLQYSRLILCFIQKRFWLSKISSKQFGFHVNIIFYCVWYLSGSCHSDVLLKCSRYITFFFFVATPIFWWSINWFFSLVRSIGAKICKLQKFYLTYNQLKAQTIYRLILNCINVYQNTINCHINFIIIFSIAMNKVWMQK